MELTKNRTTVWSSIFTTWSISEEMKTLVWKDKFTPVFTGALFTVTKTWKQPKCPSADEWINTVGTQVKKNEILPFGTIWVDLVGLMHSEISQTEKDKYCILTLICGM